MSEAGRKLFTEYVLELIADCKTKNDTIDAHIPELLARAAAADIRLNDIEEEVGLLQDALTKHLLAEQKAALPSNGGTGESANGGTGERAPY
jgi:hypothetical protein